MPEVVTQSRHAENSTPIRKLIVSGDYTTYLAIQIPVGSDDVKYSLSKFHHTERMLEPSMRCTWIDQMGQGKLMDMPQTLKRPRIKDLPLVGIQAGENMNRITNFMDVLGHLDSPQN